MGITMTSHYAIQKMDDPMSTLKDIFPDGDANELNFVLFSTSGVHGTYATIEDAEESFASDEPDGVTVLIVHPRTVCLKYGHFYPKSREEFEYLKKLRESSKRAVSAYF